MIVFSLFSMNLANLDSDFLEPQQGDVVLLCRSDEGLPLSEAKRLLQRIAIQWPHHDETSR